MKANVFNVVVAAVAALTSTVGFSAGKQKIDVQGHFQDVRSIREQLDNLSIEVKKLSDAEAKRVSGIKSVGTLVAEGGAVATDAASSTAVAPVASEADQNISLGLELRPSYYVTGNNVGSENTISAGISLSKDTSVVYEQYVDTVTTGTESVGIDPKLRDGALRVIVNNLWTSKKLGMSLSYENRSLLPLNTDKQALGRIIENRNYVRLKKNFTEEISLTIAEAPIVFGYSKDLAEQALFQNRFYIVPEAQFGGLYVGMPIWIQSTSLRNGNNEHALLAWPEVTYAVAQGIDIGAAFYTDNLMNPNFGGFNFSSGLEKGAAQLILRASL